MNHESEIAKAKWLLAGGLLFLISGCLTFSELNLWLRGHDGEARLVKAFESTSRRGGTTLTVEYEFTDADGNRRKDQQGVSLDTPLPPTDGKLPIRYTPGKDGSSRLGGHIRWGWIALFAGSVLLVAFGIVQLIREANDDGPKKRRK